MLFERSDAQKIDISVEYMLEILRAIKDKPKKQQADILLEISKEVRTFREAMTLMSAAIDDEIDLLYKESFEVALKRARNATEALEVYYLVRRSNFNEGKIALARFNEMLNDELGSAEPGNKKAEILADAILKMETDDELVEKNFPILMSAAMNVVDFGIWNSIYGCAKKHEYGLEMIVATEQMFDSRSDITELITLCKYITSSDITHTIQLLCEIGAWIDANLEDSADKKVAQWTEVLVVAPSGSWMELHAAKNLAAVICTFDEFNKAKRASKSGRANRIIARRGLEIAGSVVEFYNIALFVNEYPEIFDVALDRINGFPDTITKYFSIYGLGKERQEEAFRRMKEIEPADVREQAVLEHVTKKMQGK